MMYNLSDTALAQLSDAAQAVEACAVVRRAVQANAPWSA